MNLISVRTMNDSLKKKDRPAGKWLSGLTSKIATRDAAMNSFDKRIGAVAHWWPLAAEHYRDDIEYIHHLRVATRRASVVTRAFGFLLPGKIHRQLQGVMRQIRQVAGGPRDMDVMIQRLSSICKAKDIPDDIAAFQDGPAYEILTMAIRYLNETRQVAQRPILYAWQCHPKSEILQACDHALGAVKKNTSKKAEVPFGITAGKIVTKALKVFSRASRQNLKEAANMHAFRIAGKKLRYAVEVAGPALPSRLRKKFYPQLTHLQQLLGTWHDHIQMHACFSRYAEDPLFLQAMADADLFCEDVRIFFHGLIAAETMTIQDARQLIAEQWNRQRLLSFSEDLGKCLHG